jgi:hypothetical protein
MTKSLVTLLLLVSLLLLIFMLLLTSLLMLLGFHDVAVVSAISLDYAVILSVLLLSSPSLSPSCFCGTCCCLHP